MHTATVQSTATLFADWLFLIFLVIVFGRALFYEYFSFLNSYVFGNVVPL